jgi:hypothetical protein
MFKKLLGQLHNRSSLFIFANIGLSLVRLLYTSWCNAQSKYFGFVYTNHEWHSCVREFPGAALLIWLTIAVTLISGYVLIHDYFRAHDHLSNFKSFSVSRATYYATLLTINFQIESVATAVTAPKLTDGPDGLVFNTFIIGFPITLILFSIASWSIAKKIEWVISWK